ncbi:MAG: adenylate/guanylate cyclase domain-containing protein [Chloroflexota bacterium]
MQYPPDTSLADTRPQTRYARSGNVNIAYQVVGDKRAALDLVLVPGWMSHVEYMWEDPRIAHFLGRLASFSRLITFDKRGTGLSDRAVDLPPLEQRMDDVQAVMDAAGSQRAALLGVSEGSVMCALFAATYPQRTTALVMYGSYAKRRWSPDYPWAPTPEERQRFYDAIEQGWGGPVGLAQVAPSMADDPGFQRSWATYLRMGASPGAALALARINTDVDIRHVLAAIRVPTLILHRIGDLDMKVEEARYIARQIPGAKFVELPGDDHLWWAGDTDVILDEVEGFLTGARHGADPERVLATILFTDIVGSTEQAAALGDRRWRELLEAYYTLTRRELARFRGQEVDTAGDGFLATFDGPARAIRCAGTISRGAEQLGLRIRSGLHTGEVEIAGDKVRGIAVHTGARVAAAAGPHEVLVSTTVKDLVAGSGIRFEDRGTRTLKGVPGRWHLFRVAL